MEKLTIASKTRDAEEFLSLAFPPEWEGIAARILETGVTMSAEDKGPWAPRWTPVKPTMKVGRTESESIMRSVIYRTHDFLHQLWGLPHPKDFSEDERYYYKRAQMCGEVAVLTLTEFVFCKHLLKVYPEMSTSLYERCALQMLEGPLCGKSTLDIALRLDELLHKKIRPKWVREHKPSMDFCDYYVRMLEIDRQQIDSNWKAMKTANWKPESIPQARFGRNLTGLELTSWMIKDFNHLLSSSKTVDAGLRNFNIQRRSKIKVPLQWDS